jgi:hypothetical protein
MIPFDEVENALIAWVMNGAQLDGAHVGIADRGPVPEDTYIALRITDGPRMIGSDWTKTEIDEEDVITHHVQGPRTATLNLRCYNAPEVGSASGVSILGRVIMSQRLPSCRAILKTGHVAIGTTTSPRAVNAMREGLLFDPFAECNVELHLAADISEPGYVIEHTKFTLTVDADEQPVLWLPDPPPP